MGNGPQEARAAFGIGSGPVRLDGDCGRIRPVDERFGRMLGRSSAMQIVFDVLARAARSDATILLEGETGTGKEVSAEAIHLGSSAPRQAVLGRRLRRDAAAVAGERALRP